MDKNRIARTQLSEKVNAELSNLKEQVSDLEAQNNYAVEEE